MISGKILIIDDEPTITESLKMFLSEKGHKIATAFTGSDGLKLQSNFKPDVIILDIRLPDWDGFEVLRVLKNRGEESKVIIITAFHDMENTIKAMKLGAFEYIPKPISIDDLELSINKLLKHKKKILRSSVLVDDSDGYEENKIVGKSQTMKEIFKIIGKISETKSSVLIKGETGTGKELIARAIHYNSLVRNEPFIPINCAAIVENLFESEIFGHEKGAFTGAVSTRKGKIELAGKGTIFLDEIGETPLGLQVKLLRFLQEKEFERVGGEKTLKSDARVIAATNQDLKDLIQKKKFREDLYYRLSVVVIELPPLRERKSDIPYLVDYLMKKINYKFHTGIKKIGENALGKIMAYDWPGNIRELENVLANAALMSRSGEITEDLISIHPENQGEYMKKAPPFLLSLDEVEKKHIKTVLDYVNWNYGKACEILGITRPTLRKKIRLYNIIPPRYKVQN